MSEFTQMYGMLKARYAERERQVECLLAMIGRISDALGISQEDQATANGDEEILFAIEELMAAPAPAPDLLAEAVGLIRSVMSYDVEWDAKRRAFLAKVDGNVGAAGKDGE